MNEELASGHFGSPAELVSKFLAYLASRGLERGYLLLEYNDFGNAARAIAVRDACQGKCGFGIWLTRDFTAQQARAAVLQTGARAFVAEGEIPAQLPGGTPNPQAQDWEALVEELEDIHIDKAVATSWSPFQKWSAEANNMVPAPEIAAPLIRDGWYCQPYVYPAEHAGITVGHALAYSKHYTHEAAPAVLAEGEGWYHPEPVLGVYGGFTIDSPAFNGKDSCVGYSLWDAGEVF